jgi:hypothetical protein
MYQCSGSVGSMFMTLKSELKTHTRIIGGNPSEGQFFILGTTNMVDLMHVRVRSG